LLPALVLALVLDGYAPVDTDEALPGLKNVKGFPVEVLIDRNGDPVDVRNGYGYSKRWARKLERELIELLDAPPPAEPPAARADGGTTEPRWSFETDG
jgi:hypothetical protein